jgi:hypothetical protein
VLSVLACLSVCHLAVGYTCTGRACPGHWVLDTQLVLPRNHCRHHTRLSLSLSLTLSLCLAVCCCCCCCSPAQPQGPKYHLLSYDYVADILEKRGPYREAHLAAAKQHLDAGVCVRACVLMFECCCCCCCSPAQPQGPKYHLLSYDYVADILEKRGPYREAHLAAAKQHLDAGVCVRACVLMFECCSGVRARGAATAGWPAVLLLALEPHHTAPHAQLSCHKLLRWRQLVRHPILRCAARPAVHQGGWWPRARWATQRELSSSSRTSAG